MFRVIGSSLRGHASFRIRYREFDHLLTNDLNAFTYGLTGIVVGGELTRDIAGGFRGFGIARTAMVFGDTTGDVSVPVFNFIFDTTQTFMWEAQIGLEYYRETCLGEISLRAGGEAQYWDGVTYKSDGASLDAESIGLFGVFAGLTLRI